jgi:hypothetical protein
MEAQELMLASWNTDETSLEWGGAWQATVVVLEWWCTTAIHSARVISHAPIRLFSRRLSGTHVRTHLPLGDTIRLSGTRCTSRGHNFVVGTSNKNGKRGLLRRASSPE